MRISRLTAIAAVFLAIGVVARAPAPTADQGPAVAAETGASAGAARGGGASVASAAHERVYVLGIEGMMCPTSCAPAVQESLESIEGVRSVEVDFEHKRAVVRTDPDVELTTEQCDRSFKNQGYFVSSLEATAP